MKLHNNKNESNDFSNSYLTRDTLDKIINSVIERMSSVSNSVVRVYRTVYRCGRKTIKKEKFTVSSAL